MADGRVRWGVLSAAKIARDWVVPGIHMSDRGDLAAVASLTPGKAEALAAPYGGVTLHDSYEALLADPEVDAIYIPLPNHQHVEWTAKCLEAGKHVLCEKPLALKAEEIDGLIALRDRTGLLAAEAFMVTHHPQWIRARELFRRGRDRPAPPGAGRLHLLQRRSRQHPQPRGLGRRRVARHRGLSLDQHALRHRGGADRGDIRGDRMGPRHRRNGAGGGGVPRLRLDFYVSMRMAPRQIMTFHGETGWLSVHAPYNAGAYGDPVLELRNARGAVVLERFPRSDHYRSQIDAFNASVLDGAAYACPLEYSRGNQVMIDMIYAAAGRLPS